MSTTIPYALRAQFTKNKQWPWVWIERGFSGFVTNYYPLNRRPIADGVYSAVHWWVFQDKKLSISSLYVYPIEWVRLSALGGKVTRVHVCAKGGLLFKGNMGLIFSILVVRFKRLSNAVCIIIKAFERFNGTN